MILENSSDYRDFDNVNLSIIYLGDFRNTPIKLGADRSESVQPVTPVPMANVEDGTIEAMTPTEAENLLSTNLAEKRLGVLSDEQAQEVTGN
jgi:hypothetical protein